MANALVEDHDASSTINTSEDVDSEEENNAKQNGSIAKQMDRFGFVGGSQYTDPHLWVDLYLIWLKSLTAMV